MSSGHTGRPPSRVRRAKDWLVRRWTSEEGIARIGFHYDIIGYGRRGTTEQRRVQGRIYDVVRAALNDIGLTLERTDHDLGTGDSMSIFLPAGTNVIRAVGGLLPAMARRLARDNGSHADRMRIRMSIGVGLVANGRLGFSEKLVLDLSRLVESQPIRQAVIDHPDSDLFILVSDPLYEVVSRSDCLPPVERVWVEVKEFQAHAWLWVS